MTTLRFGPACVGQKVHRGHRHLGIIVLMTDIKDPDLRLMACEVQDVVIPEI